MQVMDPVKTSPLAHVNINPIITNIQLGEDTYTIVANPKISTENILMSPKSTEGDVDPTIRVIRRSGRWKNRQECTENRKTAQNNREMDGHDIPAVSVSAVSGDLPPPDTPQACREASMRLHSVIGSLRTDGLDAGDLISNLEYISEVLGVINAKTDEDISDDLSELASEAVPDEVRKWLASTFAKQEQVVKKPKEHPTFRSVANAIRTGIFIEKIYRRMSTSQLMVIPQNLNTFLEKVDNWNFDLFSFARAAKGSPLKFLGYHLLQHHGCLHKFKIPPPTLETLLGHLEVGYTRNGNPYHNNLHASDVLQTTHWFISQAGLKSWLSDLEIFALLLSAIIHDYDHSGTTNNFHIQSNSKMAILYNDRSVLENHHVAAFFSTMIDNDCNILNNMSKAEFREFRSLMIEMVLHTDMSMHFSQLKYMKGLIQTAVTGGSLDKTKVLCLILHSCDVSHPTKKWELHNEWTARCMEEFFRQGDMEQELGLDFSPLCDRQTTVVPQSQIGFIDFIVSPIFDVCGDMISLVLDQKEDQATKPWEKILEDNKDLWQIKAKSGETGFEVSDALNDVKPPRVVSAKPAIEENGVPENGNSEENAKQEPDPQNPESLDRRHLIKQIGPITIDSLPPDKPTKHKDVVGEVPSSVLSRPGSPVTWNFGVKESITVAPPRPLSASLLSPPERRRAPISVDHKLRKHALDF
eukprot:TRINITY_DN15506_c0_g1_i6.p1 TRINITY_DN15506_c0_g1~~TRINITY_DN15506_c0_g1_i6.p1  ORF type:complete len:696 (-),score=189.23 TRINITY_DN15506_c0_g1_i6:354-2441(-)